MLVRLLFVCILQHLLIPAEYALAQKRETQTVKVYFRNRVKDPESVDCGKGFPVQRIIRKQHSLKNKIKVVLGELLRGPTDSEREEGFYGSVPTPSQIRSHKNQILEYLKERQAPNPLDKWRASDTIVTIRKVVVVGDSVLVEFSNSMRAYGGGSCRVAEILGPMWQTLSEFRAIRTVGWAIEGSPPETSFQP